MMDGGFPDGVVTFLFTDVEGSTRLWEESRDSMMSALEKHDRIIDDVVETQNGVSVKPRGEGDSRFIVFRTATEAVQAVADIQRTLSQTEWDLPRPLRVRASLHTGAADLQLGDYYGPAVNRAARIRGIAHGGQTVISGSTWELVQDRLPDGVTCRDMGEHALKDLTRPERIYQLDIEGLSSDFPPLTSLDSVTNNLPRQLTEFIGRETELEEAKRLLKETRLLTILAPGGTGKTRLSIQAGADLLTEYPDGAYFVNLADIATTAEIVETIAESIGLVFSADEANQAQLHRYLANRDLLLIVDNFEHVIDGASVIGGILQSTNDVTVLVTSRAKLNITGETVLALGGLETSWDTPDDALRASGVRLFIDGCKRANPGFSLSSDDLEPLAEILTATGGIPLGIVLAAAWTDMLSIKEISEEISKSLDFLETELGDVPDRHRSVRAVFDYSWELLSDEERVVFSALALFRGGFTREAAAEVSGASIRHLAALANKSLLTSNPDDGRYTIHELLREYAEAELRTDDERAVAVETAHASFYADLMDRAFSLFPVSDHEQMMAIMENDQENIRHAWRRLISDRNAADLRRMIPPLHVLYELRSQYQTGATLLQEAIDGFGGSTDEQEQVVAALATNVQVWFLALMGQPNLENPRAAIEVLRDSSDSMAKWLGLQGAALNYGSLGLIEELIPITEDTMAAAREMGDDYWLAGAKNWRMLAAIQNQDLDLAKQLGAEAMEVFEKRNDLYFITWTLLLQALVAMIEGRPEDAIPIHTRQAELAQQIGYPRGRMLALDGLGKASVATGDLEAAKKAFIDGIAVAERTSMLFDLLGLMSKVGNVYGLMGETEKAVELLATVRAESHSEGQTTTDQQNAHDLAEEPLERLRQELDPDTYEAAIRRGTGRPYDAALKELLATNL